MAAPRPRPRAGSDAKPADRRTRLEPGARRAQLIALGVEMLATRTLDELSVEDLAQKAGISRGLLFHYFASKHEFHVEVARAAAEQLIARTEPDLALPPIEALHAALAAFVDYVAENPDNYKSLVRGAASGDADLRAIFDDTRSRMAGRVVAVLSGIGLPLGPQAELAVHGWVAFAEECVIRSLDAGGVRERAALLDLLTNALPALVLAAADGAAAAGALGPDGSISRATDRKQARSQGGRPN
jgi:AcrR family transcriptional regulator